jgi:hypothetical protein
MVSSAVFKQNRTFQGLKPLPESCRPFYQGRDAANVAVPSKRLSYKDSVYIPSPSR